MPNRSRKVQPFRPPRNIEFNDGADPIETAYSTMQQLLDKHDPESRQEWRVRELERVCREVAAFAKVGGLPQRVIDVLERAGVGGPIDPAFLLPITPEDFPQEAPAVALGRLGGLKGGHARAKSMTKAQRSKSARAAARARWAQKKTRP